jgi:hypothetical protein
MTQNKDLEIKVIKKFIEKTKQDRYIQFISTPKNRHKLIDDLAHFKNFKWDLFIEVNGIEEQVILTTLQKNKIPDKTCYIISENSKLDTKSLDTRQAISETIGYGMGTILVFGDADIIFFEGESINTRFISKPTK